MKSHALNRDALISVASVAVMLLAWQGAAASRLVPAIYISSPEGVLQAGRQLAEQGELGRDAALSATTYLIGMGLVVAVGIPLGIAIGWFEDVRSAAGPFISALNVIPRVALFPLMVLWLGIGMRSTVAVVFLSALLPIVLNTSQGVSQLEPTLLRVAHSFGASGRQVFFTIALPSAVPFTLAGLRLAAGRGLIGLVVGELLIGDSGLGQLVASAGQRFATAELLAAALCVTAAGMAIIQGLRSLEHRFQAWRPAHA